jgi:hypothetical protein
MSGGQGGCLKNLVTRSLKDIVCYLSFGQAKWMLNLESLVLSNLCIEKAGSPPYLFICIHSQKTPVKEQLPRPALIISFRVFFVDLV